MCVSIYLCACMSISSDYMMDMYFEVLFLNIHHTIHVVRQSDDSVFTVFGAM